MEKLKLIIHNMQMEMSMLIRQNTELHSKIIKLEHELAECKFKIKLINVG